MPNQTLRDHLLNLPVELRLHIIELVDQSFIAHIQQLEHYEQYHNCLRQIVSLSSSFLISRELQLEPHQDVFNHLQQYHLPHGLELYWILHPQHYRSFYRQLSQKHAVSVWAIKQRLSGYKNPYPNPYLTFSTYQYRNSSIHAPAFTGGRPSYSSVWWHRVNNPQIDPSTCVCTDPFLHAY